MYRLLKTNICGLEPPNLTLEVMEYRINENVIAYTYQVQFLRVVLL